MVLLARRHHIIDPGRHHCLLLNSENSVISHHKLVQPLFEIAANI